MVLIEYIKRYKATYISVIAIFLLGTIAGIFVTFKIPEKDKKEIRKLYRKCKRKFKK
ncbi:MAG: hypothetical protein HFJ45_01395 [Clostridia bacterium]|nr:hypothetical protein [Clostridia bacterium]